MMKIWKWVIAIMLAASVEAMGAGLEIANLVPTNITTTSAYFRASIVETNGSGTNPVLTVYYGTIDYATNPASWAASNQYGQAGVGSISTNIAGLLPSHKYYFRWYAIEGTATAWAATTTNFWTRPLAPTSAPAVVHHAVMVDTNGVLKAPTNFFDVNGIAGTGDVAEVAAYTNQAALGYLYGTDWTNSKSAWRPLDYGGTRVATSSVPMGGQDITDAGDINATNAAFGGSVTAQSATVTDFDAGGDVNLTNATSHVAVADGADQPVPLSQLQDTLELYGEVRLSLATNTHPVATNDRSLYGELPASGSWTQSYVLAVGSNFMDRFILTNTIAVASPGTYSAVPFTSFSGVGGPNVSNYYVLFSTDAAGTTNIFGTSTVVSVNGSLIGRPMHVYISDTSCCTNQYLGMDLYTIRQGGVSATLTMQGGDSTFHSRLETPTLGSAATVWGNITGTLADQTDLNTELTNRYTKPEIDAFQFHDAASLTGDVPHASFATNTGTAGQMLYTTDGTNQRWAAAPSGGGGATLTGLTLVAHCGDWEGEEWDGGSTTNNALTWDGYSTADATNNSLSGDAWYSSQTSFQERYFYYLVGFPAVATKIGGDGLSFQVRSSSTNPAVCKINALIDDTSGTVTNIDSMLSTVANAWNTYSLAATSLPAAWTSAVPTWAEDGITIRGLDVRLDVFSSHSNRIQCRMFIDID